jgi:hypothetical protein
MLKNQFDLPVYNTTASFSFFLFFNAGILVCTKLCR